MRRESKKKKMARSVLNKPEGGAHNGAGPMAAGTVAMLPRARGGNQSCKLLQAGGTH